MKKYAQLFLLGGVIWLSACAQSLGTLTIINNTDTTYRGNIADISLTVAPGKSWNHELAAGEHTVVIGGESIAVTITKERVTVLDPASSGCYVVANFRPQYGADPKPDVLIEDKFQQQQQFTLKESVAADYGRKLPKKIPDGTEARRLQKIACEHSDDNQQIVDSIMRIP